MDDAAEPLAPDAPASPPPMSAWRQAGLSLFWFAVNAHWLAILLILLPKQAILIGGEEFKGRTIGAIVPAGAVVAMLAAPLFGAWSDRCRARWGRRRPFLVAGTLGNVIGLLWLAYVPAVPGALAPYLLAFLWIELFNNLATAPYSALIPDIVPAAQRGSASGWMGLMSMLGMLTGAIIGLLLEDVGIRGAYCILAGLMLLGMLGTVLAIEEPPAPAAPPFRWREYLRGILAPFASRDFTWVFWTRFLVVMGTFTVQEFLQYYMRDVVAGGAEPFAYRFFGVTLARLPEQANAFFMLALLAGAILSSLKAGGLSDRYGRKRMVYLSGGLQAVVAVVFILSGRFEVAVLMGLLFGLGYGAYLAVDWALASDVLPSPDNHAKDMGVWHIAFTLPQVLALFMAGQLLDRFQAFGAAHGAPTLGYTVIFGLAFVYFVLGTVLVRQVKGAR